MYRERKGGRESCAWKDHDLLRLGSDCLRRRTGTASSSHLAISGFRVWVWGVASLGIRVYGFRVLGPRRC